MTKLCRQFGLLRPEEFLDPQLLKTKVIFAIAQLVYMHLTLIPSYFVYHNYLASGLYLTFMFLAGAWNGASYYIEVFSKRYNLKFEKKKDEVIVVAEASSEDGSEDMQEIFNLISQLESDEAEKKDQ